ncbi:MarR family winged helix-turn-helix transcriptional regulator [Microbacterium rhizomatis]|uniref:MarR family transcriptional regulator n=1 Tax=Microbacterium rhizomatis TaxID=1631477 RepID=A0A5J5J880_9MICO|nr:MarR family transcriptional regulator [Microbacterium rhizomatis]KAA9111374.1 MarR family transcriptional regulator [Microbacterium rhizomatis]
MIDSIDTDDTAAALRTATARLNRRLRAEAGQSEYTSAQVNVIRHLMEQGPATPSELARAEGVRQQSMSATVAALEAQGIVARRPDPDDKRASRVFMTPAGERAILEGRTAKQGWLIRTMTDRLTADERRILREAAALIERMLAP